MATAAVQKAIRSEPGLRNQRDGGKRNRQVHPDAPVPQFIDGDALTRYRLSLAWHLGRDARLKAGGSPGRPLIVELVVMLAGGQAIGVEVVDDGGFATLGELAADRVRQASRTVAVPPELGETPLRVGLAVLFEP